MMSAPGLPVRSALVAVAFVGAYVLTHVSAPSAASQPRTLGSIPFELSGWRGTDAPPLEPEIAEVLAADEYVHRYYEGPQGGVVEMDVAYYMTPRIGTTMHSPLNCLPGNGWDVTSVTTRSLAGATGAWDVRQVIAQRASTKYALTYWFQSRERVIANELATRFHVLGDALRRRPTDASVVRVMMPAAGSGATEQTTLAAFATRLIPEIAARLR